MHTSEPKIVSLHEPYFTHKEVLKITNVPDRTLLMWQQRHVIELFEVMYTKNRGRRLFAPIDVMMVSVLYEIVRFTGVKPSDYATPVKIILSERPQEILSFGYYKIYGFDEDRIEEQMKTELEDPMLMSIQFVGKHTEHGVTRASKLGELYDRNDTMSLLNFPHIVVPIDQLLIETRDKMKEVFNIGIE